MFYRKFSPGHVVNIPPGDYWWVFTKGHIPAHRCISLHIVAHFRAKSTYVDAMMRENRDILIPCVNPARSVMACMHSMDVLIPVDGHGQRLGGLKIP